MTTIKSQKITTPWKEYTEQGQRYRIRVHLRYDDQYGNGHNNFAITGEIERRGRYGWEEDSCGCIHEDIAKHFPEYREAIKFHLCSEKAPMHYLANVTYLAGNRDHRGLLAGESRQIVSGKTGLPCWELKRVSEGEALPRYVDSAEKPEGREIFEYVPWCRVGEGKERQLDAARACAIWPEATDEQLMLPKEDLKKLLDARLPKLLEDFRHIVESCGLKWEA